MNRPARYLFLIALTVSLSASGYAISLKEYRGEIETARGYFGSLVNGSPPETRSLDTVRRLVPKQQSIEWQGGSVEADSSWLYDAIEHLSSEPDASKRTLMATAINERLAAIVESLDEIDRATASGSTKDEEKQKIAAILARPEYQKPPPEEESLFSRWVKAFQDWFSRAFPQTPDIPDGGPQTASSIGLWLQILIYALVIGVIVFLLYRFLPFLTERFGSKEKPSSRDRVILGERVSANESASDLFAEAQELARRGDLRSAIRKGYIALLCDLADRKVISLARNKTNRDYLRDLRKRADLFAGVQSLTGQYERSWYGSQAVAPEDWDAFHARYREAITIVK